MFWLRSGRYPRRRRLGAERLVDVALEKNRFDRLDGIEADVVPGEDRLESRRDIDVDRRWRFARLDSRIAAPFILQLRRLVNSEPRSTSATPVPEGGCRGG